VDVRVDGVAFRVGGQHDDFWRRVIAGDWEPNSYAVLDHFLRPGLVLVDIGAWIGPLTLYAAAIGARCLAFEPDPVARSELVTNLALNPTLAGWVTVSECAVGARPGQVRLGNITSEQGGDSMSSLLFAEAATGWEVPAVGLGEVLCGISPEDLGLVKIDVEGAEVEILDGAADYLARQRPPLFISVHARFWRPDPLPRLRRLAELLDAYEIIMTPDFEPFPLDQMFSDSYASGLFEIVVH
jgi:FkbM family methyltransferase